MKRTPKRIPETQKAIFTKSKSLDAIIIMMIIMLGLGSRDKRMTNSPWAVGTNGKFTESATFHNSARRQLSTNLAEGSREFGAKQARNSVRPVVVVGGDKKKLPRATQCYNFHSSQHFPSADWQPHPVNTNSNNNNSPKTTKAETKQRQKIGVGVKEEERL